MKENEILEIAKWQSGSLLFELDSELFGKTIKFCISFDEGEDKVISEIALRTIEDFLKLTKQDLENINDEIWNHCLACNQSQTSKGSRDGGKTWFDTSSTLEENLAEYNIKNKEDALAQSSINSVYLANIWDADEKDTIFYLRISVSWDGEHGMSINYCNGVIDDIE